MQHNTSKRYELFQRDQLKSGTSLSASYDLLKPAPKVRIAIELAFREDSTSSTFSGGVVHDTSWDYWNVQAGAVARYELFSWLDPYARIAGGLSRTKTSISNATDTLNAESYAPVGTAGIGLAVHGFTPARFAVGAFVDGGFVAEGSHALEFEDDGDERIPTQLASLGDVEQSGRYIRIGAMVRF